MSVNTLLLGTDAKEEDNEDRRSPFASSKSETYIVYVFTGQAFQAECFLYSPSLEKNIT